MSCKSARVLTPVLTIVLTAACSGSSSTDNTDSTDSGQTPDIVDISPADGSTDVSIADRVTVSIDDNNRGLGCRLAMDETTVTVTVDGDPVAGALVHFIDQLRVDFTPSGMFAPATTYHVAAEVDCAVPVESTFTTRAADAAPPSVAVGTAFRIVALDIEEPEPLENLLEGFLADGNLLAEVLGEGTGTITLLGGEGDLASRVAGPLPADANLLVYRRDAFLFPMLGTYRPPYFQVEGSLAIPVDDTQDIVLERFEISGRFVDSGGGVLQVAEASIRASSTCDAVCSVANTDLALICGNRETICDTAGNLNLVGNFEGAPNDLSTFSSITPIPADQQTGVATDAVIHLELGRAVSDRGRAVIVVLRPSGEPATSDLAYEVPCTADTAEPVTAVTCTPAMPLAVATEYTMLVVAHRAQEFTFSTQ